MNNLIRNFAAFALAFAAASGWAQKPSGVGVVLLHGSGGSPMSMSTLSYELRERGHLVVAPEMPWSAMRNHDVPIEAALREVEREVDALRKKGARRIVLAGFSKGGLFASYAASRHPPDALVLISPNGVIRAGDAELAQRLVAEGKGTEKTQLELFDPMAQRRYPVFTNPQAFLSWFGADTPVRFEKLLEGLPQALPVLLVVANRDFDNLLAARSDLYERLPAHPARRLYMADSNHIGAINASALEVVRWIDSALKRR